MEYILANAANELVKGVTLYAGNVDPTTLIMHLYADKECTKGITCEELAELSDTHIRINISALDMPDGINIFLYVTALAVDTDTSLPFACEVVMGNATSTNGLWLYCVDANKTLPF